MAATPDDSARADGGRPTRDSQQPAGGPRPPDAEAALVAAEAAHLATRDTVPIDVRPDPLTQRETVRLPEQRAPRGGRGGRRRAPLALAAAVATGWAAAVSAAPVALALALAQLVEGGGSAGGALRLGLAGWLLGHGVPLETEAGRLALAPLGLAGLAAWRVVRAGVHTTRGIGARGSGSVRRALAAAGAIGTWYGLLGGLAALVVDAGGGPGVAPSRAVIEFFGFGAVFGLVGAVHATGALTPAVERLPGVLRDGLRTGAVVALLLLGAGAAAAGGSLALGAGEAGDVFAAYRTGVAGQAGITLICLAYAPNAATWAAAYLIGPGFAVGTGTVVRVTDVTVGGLPAIPIFAGLPAGPLGGAGAALIGIPVIAGMVGGWLLVRRRVREAAAAPTRRRTRGSGAARPVRREGAEPMPPGLAWPGLLGAAAVAGPVAGLLLGAAAFASRGSLGGDRLAEIGPVAWQVAVVGAGVVAAGAMIGATAGRSPKGGPSRP